MSNASLKILLLTDGKAGHLSQLEGLADAIGRLTPASVHTVSVGPFGAIDSLNFTPDLAIAAGRSTHLGLWRVHRRDGVKSICLMRPSIPGLQFDLTIAPEHDGLAESPSVWTTFGALNSVTRPAENTARSGGVVLVGGPSKHHRWDDGKVFASLHSLVQNSGSAWTVTTSRRTPRSTAERLAIKAADELPLQFLPHTKTPKGWLSATLQRSSEAVVTEDSVSMISEALTAGCRTSIIAQPRNRESRITRYVDSLLDRSAACTFGNRQGFAPKIQLAEADRIASRLLTTWWPDRVGSRAA